MNDKQAYRSTKKIKMLEQMLENNKKMRCLNFSNNAFTWQSTLQMIQCNHLGSPFLCSVAVSFLDCRFFVSKILGSCIFRLENATFFRFKFRLNRNKDICELHQI